MKDNWKKLQKEKIDRKHQLDVKKVISEDTRFMSNIDKRINNIKNVIDDPDVYNVNIASRERLNKVEQSIEDLAVQSHKPINFTKRLDELHNKIDSIYSLLETLSDRLNHMEYTGEVSYGDKHSVGRNNKIVKVRLKRKDKIDSPNSHE